MSLLPPPPKIENNWRPFELPLKIGSGRNFTPGESGIRMAFFEEEKTKALVGRVWFGEGIEGPPKHVHGGVSTYVLDEAMGSASWLSGYGAVAANLNVDFLNMTPIGVDLLVRADIERVEGADVFIRAQILDDAGKIYSQAIGRFRRLPKAKLLGFLSSQQIDVTRLGLKFVEDGF